jgi:hypothetical protein
MNETKGGLAARCLKPSNCSMSGNPVELKQNTKYEAWQRCISSLLKQPRGVALTLHCPHRIFFLVEVYLLLAYTSLLDLFYIKMGKVSILFGTLLFRTC